VASGGLRERKKRRTREAIEAAALSLFERQGFDRTTVDEIAAEAGVSSRTFFRYFESKENVVLVDPRRRSEITVAAFRDQPPGPVEGRLAAALVAVARWVAENDYEVAARTRVLTGHAALMSRALLHLSMSQDALAGALALSESREEPDLRDRVLAATSISVFVAAAREWRDGGAAVPLPDLVAEGFRSINWVADS